MHFSWFMGHTYIPGSRSRSQPSHLRLKTSINSHDKGRAVMWLSGDFNTFFVLGGGFVCLFLHQSTGCILGVGLVLSLMSHSSRMESRVHVAASLRKLSTYLDDSGSQSRTFQEVGAGGDGFLPIVVFCFPVAAYFLLLMFW